jgi:hypothetical protein
MHTSARLVKCVSSVQIDEKPPKATTIRKCEKQLGINNLLLFNPTITSTSSLFNP